MTASMVARLRARRPWFDHLVRAGKRYLDYRGYQYAASITYFSVLSIVPMLMLALSGSGFLLTGHPTLLASLHTAVHQAVPASLTTVTDRLVDNIVDHRLNLGLVGLVIALYSGWNWMNALRDALTGMWDRRRAPGSLVRTVLKDLLALLGLAIALLVSFGFTALGGALGGLVLRALGLDGEGWALWVASIVLSLLADWLVFAWVLGKLPRCQVRFRDAISVSFACAIGFELLKRLGNLYLDAIGRSPTGLVFGSLVGALVFVYLVSRLLVLAAAWMASARAAASVPEAPPTVIRPAGPVRRY
jgi:membrane protein